MNKYNNTTSIRFDEDVKTWLYRKMQVENRSLGNLVNTILKREIQRDQSIEIEMPSIHGMDSILNTHK
jgi:hypothetical protein